MRRYSGITFIALALLLAGCGRAVVEGRVVDERGEGLPGVAVMLAGADRQALTDARGDFRFVCPPGVYDAAYAKSGYTLGAGTVDTSNSRWAKVGTVSLWNVPPKDGVYLYKEGRYRATVWMMPKQFFMIDGTMRYGIQRVPNVHTDDDMPQLMFYKMPRYDVRLSRLQEVTAKLPSDDSQTFSIWTAAGTLTTDLVPVVTSDPWLLKLEVTDPLQPGYYAVHWGALDGYTTINERIYVFEVREPVMPVFEHVEPRMELAPTKEERRKSRPAQGDAP